MQRSILAAGSAAAALLMMGAAAAPSHDVIVRGGTIYDGSGGAPFVGDVAIDGDRIVYVGPHADGVGKTVIDARGQAVAPGFINMLSWSVESLLVDGKSQSELRQGITLEVFGEGDSMGPFTDKMKALGEQRQGDFKYKIDWTTLDEYLTKLEKKGVAPNVASFVGATTVREYVLGEDDVDPTPEQLAQMRALVKKAMEDGAMGVGSSMIYAPASYAETPELVALMQEAGKCGGMYITHMRSEGDRLLEAVDETIEIARQSGAPAEMYHMKQSGRDNWGKLDQVIAKVEAARAQGIRITADMYTYTAGATGLDAAMPTWVQSGGLEKWIENLKKPEIRAKVLAEMRQPHPKDWENLGAAAGPDGVLFADFKNPALRKYIGKTLTQVAKERGTSPEDTAIDLVIEDGSRVGTIYFLMKEENVARQTALPWVSFGSDAESSAPEGVFLHSSTHPRAYGNFARFLGKYVRDEHTTTLQDAVRKLAALPADNLGLTDRGRLKTGNYADVVVFDPKTISDHATFEKPMQYATGVNYVLVNGELALKDGTPTGAHSGRAVRGRAWTGRPGGGCKASAKDWTWTWNQPAGAK
jgi:N-acyl-D-amino-acid deacylase